jgi:hypothetical protein
VCDPQWPQTCVVMYYNCFTRCELMLGRITQYLSEQAGEFPVIVHSLLAN